MPRRQLTIRERETMQEEVLRLWLREHMTKADSLTAERMLDELLDKLAPLKE